MAAGLLLARDGHEVTVFERFAAAQPLGSGLMIQPTGLAVLEALGLGGRLTAMAAPIERLFGRAAGSGAVVLDVRYAALGRPGVVGLGVHRAALFDLLHAAVAEAGMPVVTGRAVAGSERGPGGRSLVFEDGGREGPFDLVVDALGHASTLAPPTGRALDYGALWASLDWPQDAQGLDGAALEQRYHRASVMTGVLPIGVTPGQARPQTAFFWSLRADRLAAWRQAGLAPWKREVEALWPATASLLDQITSPDQLTFARYQHRTLSRPMGEGLVHIGDAWHSTSPQLGQGANMALLDAYALALALRSGAGLDEALGRYHRLRRLHVRLYQSLSYFLTPVYQSDSLVLPWLRDRLVGPLGRLWPASVILAAMVGGLLGAPLGRLGLREGKQA
jgi:salicylate hydroxylase